MPSTRWNGGVLGPANTPTATTASGVWNLERAQVAQGAGIWPTLVTPTIEYLVVAGGGGGGYGVGGSHLGSGGGAGGYRTDTAYAVSVGTTYNITVGGGGSHTQTSNTSGGKGSDSSFGPTGSLITSEGGGGGAGGGGGGANAGNGGSGGAGAYLNPTAGTGNAGPPRQGYNGATYGVGGASYQGGGASAVGNAGSGDDNNGTFNSISGSSVQYSRGGQANRTPVANTGGGGGGANSSVPSYGSAGAAGVVIIKYREQYRAATYTGSPTVTISGGHRIYVFTGAGTISF